MSSPTTKRNPKLRPPIKTAKVVADPPGGAAAESPGPGVLEPDPGKIARLAYSYWEARGRNGGNPEEDWLRAEQQLRSMKPEQE
jgi:hypothetical protein